ncbi:MAG: cupin domain-containing protein [Gaiellaceae bacterium]
MQGAGTGAASSGSSVLEIDPGRRLPRHTDSAEETIVVISGDAEVLIEGAAAELREGVALVPANAKHEVKNVGDETLRFVAVYADANVTTTYEEDVQPDGGRERESTA